MKLKFPPFKAAFALCAFVLMSAMVFAQSSGATIDMSDGAPPASGTGWIYAGNLYTILNGANVTVTGNNQSNAASERRIVVNAGATANIRFQNVTIDVSATDNACAFDVTGATANLTLVGSNFLTSGSGRAGLAVPGPASTLTIDGFPSGSSTGNLTVTGGGLPTDRVSANSGAGIGGGLGQSGGTIIINGGTIVAVSNGRGAGIGGGGNSGMGGAGGEITITGGTVTANGRNGAGIGGGSGSSGGSGGIITIENCTVEASSMNYGTGIGGGGAFTSTNNGGDGGIITITGSTVTASGGVGGAGIGGGMGGASSSGGSGGEITINNSNVTATGGNGSNSSSIGSSTGHSFGGAGGAGIGGGGISINGDGSGSGGSGGIISIDNSDVTAIGGSGGSSSYNGGGSGGNGGAGIGGGGGSDGGNAGSISITSPGFFVISGGEGGDGASENGNSGANVGTGGGYTGTVEEEPGFYYIHLIIDGSGKTTPGGSILFPIGESRTVTYTFTPNIGYHLDGVYINGIFNEQAFLDATYTFNDATGDDTIYIIFAIDTFIITATASNFGTITPVGAITVNYGSSQTFTYTPNPDAEVKSLIIDGISEPSFALYGGVYTFTNITTNHTIEVIFFACPLSIEDHEGNEYPVVRFSKMCWTAANLRTTTYQDGTAVPFTKAYYHEPQNTDSTFYKTLFGLLYTYESIFSDPPRTLCPNGWRLPTSAELLLLNMYSADDLKNPTYWISPNSNTNLTGFDSRGAGIYNSAIDRYEKLYSYTAYWSSDAPTSEGTCHAGALNYHCSQVEIVQIKMTDGVSVRCVVND